MNVIKETIKELKILMACLIVLSVFALIHTINFLYQLTNGQAVIWAFETMVLSLLFCYFIYWAINIFKEIDIIIQKEFKEGRKEN